MVSSASTGQNAAFPGKTGAPLVDSNGNITQPWYRMLLTLWQRVGGSSVVNENFYYIDNSGGSPVIVNPQGTSGGTIPTSGGAGGPAQPQVLGASPWTYAATQAGSLVVDAGKVQVSRDGGVSWYSVGYLGGMVRLLAGDQAKVSWVGDPPVVAFLPGG